MGRESFWVRSATGSREACDALDGDREVDVAIIGAGISGLTCAYLLAHSGKRIAVVEKDRVAQGESGRTTAHVTEIFDRRFDDLIDDFGVEEARRAAGAGRAALDCIARVIETEGIDCDFQRVPAFLYSETGHEDDELIREWDAVRRVGVRCRNLAEVSLPYPVQAALRFDDQAQFHPRKYLLALAEAARRRGVAIYENTPVLQIDEGEPSVVETAGGRLRAGKLVVAANVPINNRFSMHTKLAAYRTYALAVRSPAAAKLAGLFWDSMDPYHFIRTANWAGPAGPERVLIIGGEDHKTGAKERTDKCYHQLQLFARNYFGADEVVASWSGQIIEPVDGLPYIGRNPHSRDVYLATGFSGQGMSMGTLAGVVISDLIEERDSEWESLFDPSRFKVVTSAGAFLAENKDFPLHFLLDRWAEKDALGVATVAPGEGRVVRVGSRALAVYRDESSRLHALSPVCPHMGCHVHWNRAEKSWDCPCHGSRFGTDGEVLNGPALEGLRVLDTEELADRYRRRRKGHGEAA